MVQVLEADDGSGWVKVVDNRGGKGLVPASYVESSKSEALTPSPVHFRSSQGSQKYGTPIVLCYQE
jgi:formin-binding protein 1